MPLISMPLERALLRRSMVAHEDQRHRCVHCHRTPLTGEVVHVYAAPGGETLVCELCRPLRREVPARSLLVHAPEQVADEVAALLHDVLGSTAARWAAGSGVRFVADVSVVRRWSDAKG